MTFFEWLINQLIGFIFSTWPRKTPTLIALQSCRLVAHRGVHENQLAVENSMKSLELCVENKIWAAEFDVRFTADNIPIVVHDEDAGRLWGRNNIKFSESPWADIHRQLPGIASLESVVQKMAKKLHLMIEIKVDLKDRPLQIAALRKVLTELTPVVDYHLLALDPYLLEPLTFCPKTAYLDVIWLSAKKMFRQHELLGHGAIAGHFLFFDQNRINSLKKRNSQVAVGFLDSQNSLFRELNREVDFIFTNHPLRLNQFVSEALDRVKRND